MTRNLRHIRIVCSAFLVLFLGTAGPLAAQDEDKPQRTRHRIGYFQEADSLRYFQSYLYVSDRGEKTELQGETVKLFLVTDTAEVLIAEAQTGPAGRAELIPGISMTSLADSAGSVSVLARYEGSHRYEESEADMDVRLLDVRLAFEASDSLKTVSVTAVNSKTGESVEDLEFTAYVERMFRPLKVSEAETDRRGRAALVLPNDIPGDAEGMLQVSVRVEDDRDFGNYVSTHELIWGVPAAQPASGIQRALWSPYAPLWMVIVFVVLMTAVWGHYIVILYELAQVKKEGAGHTDRIMWDV